MADSSVQDEKHNVPQEPLQESSLKYLGVVHGIALGVTAMLCSIYEFAKENSGSLKPGVESVEGTVKAITGPIYQKLEARPYEILQALDSKVDETVQAVRKNMPWKMNKKVDEGYNMLLQVLEGLKCMAMEMRKDGAYETAKDYYTRYEPVAEELTAKAWKKMLQVPILSQAIHVIAPPTLYGMERMNDLIAAFKHHSFPLSSYMPMMPVQKFEILVSAHEG